MENKEQEFMAEKAYLDTVLDFLRSEIANIRENLEIRKNQLYRIRRDQGVLVSDVTSPGISSDLTQNLLEDQRQLSSIEALTKRLIQYERLLSSPYFGRFDFLEDGERSPDKIYIGLHNVYDSSTGDIYVYDWRAPICSMFYRYEPGRAAFTAPGGEIEGEMTLKRQYSIVRSKLQYFFDCSLVINDEILQDVLGHNASPKMQNIVRTIQSEQDLVIRNTKSDLLIAQGAAGSGKTSIALHRIAYLLYEGAASGLTSDNVVIISLSDVFSKYIGSVLPELGEKNVREMTFDEVAETLTGVEPNESRLDFIDGLIKAETENNPLPLDSYRFKGSRVFAEISERFLRYYEENLIEFKDIIYDDIIIAKSGELKAQFLDNKIGAPSCSRLRRLENMLKNKIDLCQKALHKKLEAEYKQMPEHRFDYKTVARYHAIKETQRVMKLISSFTKLDAVTVYRALFSDRKRFESICEGLDLPANVGEIFERTAGYLENGVGYEDMAPLCYLAVVLDRNDAFSDVKQAVIDEAQDYLPIHYAVFGRIFKWAKFTVLGDVGQSVETAATSAIYDDAIDLLNKRRPTLLTLKKSYRCSYEIMNLALKIPQSRPDIVPFERHETEPELVRCGEDALADRLAADISAALDAGFDTAAVICKTQERARELYESLRGKISIRLLESSGEMGRGAMILPVYLSKGLEFDCVFVPDVDDNYSAPLSRRLLYIACTRALHRLNIYYDKDSEIIKRLKD